MTFNAAELSEPTADLVAGLEAAGLPTDDLHEPGRRFYRFEDDGGLIGYGGLEQTGADTLIRSIAVVGDGRGEGHGSAILSWLETRAAAQQASALYLLTTSATAFFQRHGYAVLPVRPPRPPSPPRANSAPCARRLRRSCSRSCVPNDPPSRPARSRPSARA
ncbi:GNAT family N-acetyltransferase [Brevundimonas sp. RM1]|jgi:N-acetylglutamate synthase-like GNAT family acetyltransferase